MNYDTIDFDILGRNIFYMRQALHISQTTCAKLLHVTQEQIMRTEHNKPGGLQYNSVALLRIASLAGCRYEELLQTDLREYFLCQFNNYSRERFSANFRYIRKKSGLSQEKIGEILGGYTRKQINMVENHPDYSLIGSPEFILAVASYSGYKVEELFSCCLCCTQLGGEK